MLTGVIMASGQSQRMKKNKLLLEYHGRPLFTYIVEAVIASDIDSIIVVTAYEEIMQYCKERKIESVRNSSPQMGQSHTIHIGVSHANPKSDYMFFVADQPMLHAETIAQIIQFYRENHDSIIVPTYDNIPVNPKVFPNSVRSSLLALSEQSRGSQIIKQYPELVKQFAIPSENASHQFIDIDTPDDYQRLLNDLH